LSPEERALIEAVWEAKRAGGGSVVWPDGVRLDLDGREVDNYASVSADEYFAQLTNAYLGTNHGSDGATGRPRNNGAAYVRRHERELLPLLERLYGTDPGAFSTPANPVAATAADDAVYEAFRDAMALTDQAAPTGQAALPAQAAGTLSAQAPAAAHTGTADRPEAAFATRPGPQAASGAEAVPALDQLRTSTVTYRHEAVGRDFHGRWPVPSLARRPRQYQWLEHTTGLSGQRGYAPVGTSAHLPPALTARTPYLVQARLVRGTSDRIKVTDAATGAPRELTFTEFARVLAADPHLARMDPAVPVVVLVPDALSRNLDLLRAVRDVAGRPAWGHTGRAMLVEESRGRLVIAVARDEGRSIGQWIHLPADSRGQRPEPAEPLLTMDGALIDPADLDLRPFADSDGRVAGHRSLEETEFASVFELRLPGAVHTADYRHAQKIAQDHVVVTGTGRVPWAAQSPGPYFLLAHGLPGLVQLVTSDGGSVRLSGQQVGRLLRRRRSFTELFPESAITALVCHGAAVPPGPSDTPTFIQGLANSSGRTAYGVPPLLSVDERAPWLSVYNHERTGEPYTWKVAVSEPRRGVLDALVHSTGLGSSAGEPSPQDRTLMIQVLRTGLDLYGVRGREPRNLRPLGELARLRRAAYVGPVGTEPVDTEPFDRTLVQEIAREAYGWDASAKVADADVTHLLDLVALHEPATLADLIDLGRANGRLLPPGNSLNPSLTQTGPADGDGLRGAGVRGAPPGSRRSAQAAATGATGGSRPQGQAPLSLSPAEARRLAVGAVEADSLALRTQDDYVREPALERSFVEQVTQQLLEIVPRALAVRPFAPTVEIARLFMEVDQPADVRPEVLPYLAEQPDLLASVSEAPELRKAFLTQPVSFAQLLGAHPNVLRELASGSSNADLSDQAEFLLRYPDVVKAMENDAHLRRRLVQRITLIGDLGGKLVLVRAVADHRWLGDAVTAAPQLGEALRTSPAPMAAVRTLKNNLALTNAIENYPDAVPDADQIKGLLANTALVQATYQHPQQLRTLFRVPELLTAARKDPTVLRLLDTDPDLSDVLPESPELARRLAEAPELLRAAFTNSRLADALSYEPRRFDRHLDDDSRLGQLLEEAVPDVPLLPEPQPGASAPQRLLADPRVYAAVVGDTEMRHTLLEEEELAETLLENPGLLVAPHEYRRLLSPDYAALRDQVGPGSPLLAPGLLRGLLRFPGGSGSVADEFAVPDTIDAGPDDTRRILADALASSHVLQAVVQADPVAMGLAFNTATGLGQMDFGGIEMALRAEGRLAALFDRNPFAVPFLGKQSSALADLLANDSALLQLALAARELIATLQESSELLAHLVERPAVVRALAAYENDVTPSAHWARLFGDRELLAALDSADGLAVVKALASSPDLLTDGLARDGFITRLKEPGGLAELVDLNRRSSKVFAEAVRTAGEPSVTRSGIRIAAEPAAVARAVLDAPDGIGAAVDGLTVTEETRERYRGAAVAAVRALRELPELRRAVDREFGILLAMLTNGEMTATLLKRPALIGYLADRSKGALKALYDNPELTRALRDNGRLYLHFQGDAYFVQAMAGPTFRPFADALAQNPEYIRAYETGLPVILSDGPGVLLIRSSEVVAAAVADDREIATGLAENPELVDEMAELFRFDPETPLTDQAYEDGEAAVGAVVSSVTVLRALGERPDLMSVLAAGPAFSRVLAENPGALATEADVVGLLGDELLVAFLNAYPAQAALVLGTPGLLPVVARTPALVGAMARSERLSGLLGREDVRGLLGERPEVAEGLLATPDLVDALGGLPGLVAALRAKPAVAGLLRSDPGLLAVVRARRALVDDLSRDTALWRALTRVPALSEALAQSARVLRHLRSRPALIEVLASGPVAVSGTQLLAVLSDDALTAVLDGRPRLAGAVLASPELADRAVSHTGFADAVRNLSRDAARFEALLREPAALLTELDRRQESSRASGTAGRQAPRKETSAPTDRSSRTAVPAPGSTRTSAETDVQALVRRIPALRPLQRDHREALVALSRDEEVLGLLEKTGLLPRVVASPELAALVAAFPDLAEEWQSAPGRMEEFR
ncbi:hypothetical protein ACFYPN_33565, partial [Streptomyces sp. NPDC005576]|uniref:hypothetical protein n=1 Tax=unclassified Streptomyces TaxID=2593676 RepID=UPI0033F16CE1